MPLNVERTSPTTLVVTRPFAAPLQRVWDAHIRPDLLRRWMNGYEGWMLSTCEVDARPGGAIRYEWSNPAMGGGFHLTGHFEIVEPPAQGRARTVHVEVMHLPDPTPPNTVETRFDATEGGTLLTMTMQVDDPASMEAMIATGMTDGMEWSYAQLDALEAEAA
ncbi:SRPBCC domain-containing protein [Rubellimicrobium arenae]|uniref:SRPBCC domain-containing protein n=1 Tax=Rubellimicrobium arenae TaxID=2817372 RepID=UPI001B30B296|nr:SRPBCC domain-containing protein [Rubellimicrobium arenae]